MKPKYALTMGDPCGIGPEIILKALHDYPDLYDFCDPIVVGEKSIFQSLAQKSRNKNRSFRFYPW